MVAIEEILWNIFTYYSLNGNPKDPSRLHMMGLVKFCKDIMAMDNTMTEKALTQAELQLIYTAAIKSPEKQQSSTYTKEKVDKIDFDGFLSCLIRIARKCYPSCGNKEEAMQQLLMDNVLPLATRRKPVTVALLLKQPQIDALFKYYEEALHEIYKFYTTSSDLRKKGHNMLRSTAHTVDVFDNEVELIEESKLKAYRELTTANKMCFADFIRFSNDFGLVTGLGITTLDLGDVYLTVIYFQNFTPSLRRIDFKEFWECLVRCALVAFQDKKGLTTEIKIKGLFLSIWRHFQSSVQDHMSGYGTMQGGGFNTYKGALLRGTQLLNDRFIAAWTKDDYHDYLSPLVAPNPTHVSAMAPPAPPSPPPLPTTLSNLLGSSTKGKSSRGRTASGKSDNDFSTMSPSPNKKGVQKGSAGKSKELDELTRDKLLHIADDNVEQSDNFLIKTKNDRIIRIMISDYEEFEDRRLIPSDLRKLFFTNPSIAELLYEEMLEAGLVEGEPDIDESENNEEEDDFGGGGERDEPLELDDLEEELSAPISLKKQISQERRTAGGDSSSDIGGDVGGGGFEENEEDDYDNMEGLHNLDDNDL